MGLKNKEETMRQDYGNIPVKCFRSKDVKEAIERYIVVLEATHNGDPLYTRKGLLERFKEIFGDYEEVDK